MIRSNFLLNFRRPALAIALLLCVSAFAQQPAGTSVDVSNSRQAQTLPPPPTAPKPPVDLFRSLLVMSPAELRDFLAKRPPDAQKLILAKIQEYRGLTPEMRELRLRVTELRWYLLPLLSTVPGDRASRLTALPADLRELIEARLREWDKLNPEVQKQFLENQDTLRFYFELAARTPVQLAERGTNTPAVSRESVQQGIQRWQALTDEQRQDVVRHFRQFLDFTPAEKQRLLRTLSAPERVQIEKTLQTFGGLSTAQRIQCVRSFEKFASFTPEERQQFLHNAERWERMSPTDRQAWRNLVSSLSHQPPLPGQFNPPPVPGRPPTKVINPPPTGNSWATNSN